MKLSIHTFGILWKTLFGFSYYKSMDNFKAFHLYNLIKIKTLISEELFYINIYLIETAIFLLSRPPLLCTISLHPFLFHTYVHLLAHYACRALFKTMIEPIFLSSCNQNSYTYFFLTETNGLTQLLYSMHSICCTRWRFIN